MSPPNSMIDHRLKPPVVDVHTPLAPLAFPVNFITKDSAKWSDLLNNEDLPADTDEVIARSSTGNDVWAVQSYIHLKRRGLNVFLRDRFVSGEVCIAPYHFIAARDLAYNSFVIASRLDSARPEICEMQTVLNGVCVRKETDHFIPQWPLAGILPRDPERGGRVEVIDFKGDIRYNLAEPFRSEDFLRRLGEMGMRFIHSSTATNQMMVDFKDYRNSDVLLAVRNATVEDLKVKPACKLVNAWLGGCPALLGPEPAYQELRKSPLDYIEVRSPEEVLTALQKLRDDPDLYCDMVANGYKRALEFTTDEVAKRWHRFLSDIVAPRYQQWRRQGVIAKHLGRRAKFAIRVLAHKREYNMYLRVRDSGERLF